MKILLTGGGTAGHAWPIILIGKSLLKNKRVKILFVGSRQGVERQLALKHSIPFKAILVGKRRSYFSLSNFWDLFKILIGIIEVFFIIIKFKPDIIFAKGGYVTYPVIFWLNLLKIPLVIHESDAILGKANSLALNKASKICLGFPIREYKENLPLEKLVYTGIPVAEDFLQTPISTGERLKLLITGGSQGSSKINGFISEILPNLLKNYEVIHISGKRDFEKLKNFKDPNYHLCNFTDQMPKLMRDADLVVTRAGASTLAEISAAGKPAIIIPLESAKSEHQEANAAIYQNKNAGVVVSEKNLSSGSLLSIIDNLMTDEKMRKLLGHHAKSLFQPEAVREIVDLLFEVLNKTDVWKN